jgi:hypothetical protein
MFLAARLFILTMMIILTGGCGTGNHSMSSPPGYDLNRPDIFFMPSNLIEISGIAFRNRKADAIYAIQDEDGKLFRLLWGDKKQKNIKFGKHGDYEDVAILLNTAFVLKSNGSIFKLAFSDNDFGKDINAVEIKEAVPEGEYEGLYAAADSNKLYILCKNCAVDNNKNAVSGYILDAAESNLKRKEKFSIDVDAITAAGGKMKKRFHPSGLAQHPFTGQWFIISAVNKLLVVTDSRWKVQATYHLNGNVFNQPEGIAFDEEGNLYISNEGDDISEANILRYVWKRG